VTGECEVCVGELERSLEPDPGRKCDVVDWTLSLLRPLRNLPLVRSRPFVPSEATHRLIGLSLAAPSNEGIREQGAASDGPVLIALRLPA